MKHLAAAALLVLCACSAESTTPTLSNSSPPSTPTSTQVQTTTTQRSTTSSTSAATTTTQNAIELPSYEVLAEEDVSFPGAVRFAVRVAVEEGTTVEQLRALASELTHLYRQDREYQALTLFFYHYPGMANDIATLGRWEDAPYGDWARADEVERGDYSKHESLDELKDKDWSLLPSQSEVDLYLAYLSTFDEMDTGDQLPSDDDVFEAVARSFGVSPSEVESAADAVLDWMFDG